MKTNPEQHLDHGFVVDRRRTPDRRTVWRGGRRDSDWISRPPGAWARITAPPDPPRRRWQAVLSTLNLW
jgi:hypothetical protein